MQMRGHLLPSARPTNVSPVGQVATQVVQHKAEFWPNEVREIIIRQKSQGRSSMDQTQDHNHNKARAMC